MGRYKMQTRKNKTKKEKGRRKQKVRKLNDTNLRGWKARIGVHAWRERRKGKRLKIYKRDSTAIKGVGRAIYRDRYCLKKKKMVKEKSIKGRKDVERGKP